LVADTRPAVSQLADRITEDEVKAAVRDYLLALGYSVEVAWERTPGIDIDARHPSRKRHIIEAKAETGSSGAQQVNYFIGMLGELLQRMDDEDATYGIALPENRQYRGLVERLPRLARDRIGLHVFWVARGSDGGLRVRHEVRTGAAVFFRRDPACTSTRGPGGRQSTPSGVGGSHPCAL